MTWNDNKKTAPKAEDLFIPEREPPSDDFNLKKVRKRLKESEEEQAKIREKALTHKFIKGHNYFIHDSNETRYWDRFMYVFTYQGKQGKHHVFRHVSGNWIITFTDPQLIGKFIKEEKDAQ